MKSFAIETPSQEIYSAFHGILAPGMCSEVHSPKNAIQSTPSHNVLFLDLSLPRMPSHGICYIFLRTPTQGVYAKADLPNNIAFWKYYLKKSLDKQMKCKYGLRVDKKNPM